MSDLTYLTTSVLDATRYIKESLANISVTLDEGNVINQEFTEIRKKDDKIHHKALLERLIRERERHEMEKVIHQKLLEDCELNRAFRENELELLELRKQESRKNAEYIETLLHPKMITTKAPLVERFELEAAALLLPDGVDINNLKLPEHPIPVLRNFMSEKNVGWASNIKLQDDKIMCHLFITNAGVKAMIKDGFLEAIASVTMGENPRIESAVLRLKNDKEVSDESKRPS